ncbi:hypothetical protein GJ496_005431 [Pomphorhynchus laevis]|nr:hypothetical protein GJ496_005431 [Pomphorhynchus laevis]
MKIKLLQRMMKFTTERAFCCTAVHTGVLSAILIKQHVLPLTFVSSYNTKTRKPGVEETNNFNRHEDCDVNDDADNDSHFSHNIDKSKLHAGYNVITTRVKHLRADLVICATTNISRRSCERYMLQSSIKLNGNTLTKKSAQLNRDDIIDIVIKEPEIECTDPEFLNSLKWKRILLNDYIEVKKHFHIRVIRWQHSLLTSV